MITHALPDYTKELYPHADVLVQYLNDFAESLRSTSNTIRAWPRSHAKLMAIVTLSPRSPWAGIQLQMSALATGAVKPNIPRTSRN